MIGEKIGGLQNVLEWVVKLHSVVTGIDEIFSVGRYGLIESILKLSGVSSIQKACLKSFD